MRRIPAIAGLSLGSLALLALAGCGGDGSSAPAPVASVVLPTAASVLELDTLRLTPTLSDASGKALKGRAVAWSSSDPSVIEATSAGALVARRPGAATVTATSEGVTGSTTVTTTPLAVATIAFAAPGGRHWMGDTVRLTPIPKDAKGRTLLGRTATWASDLSIATSLGDGAFLLTGKGNAILSASIGGATGRYTATIVPPLHALAAYPSALSLAPNAGGPLYVLGTDVLGDSVAGLTVSYTSSNTAVATVSATGRVTAVAPGSATITASASAPATKTAAVPVTVAAEPASAFRFEVRFAKTPAAGVEAVAQAAAARWGRVVVGDIPDLPVAISAGTCGRGTPPVSEVIDDVIVLITVDSIDGPGKALASAGPCILRSGSRLPLIGVMTIDSADVASYVLNPNTGMNLLAHEMGHVLGIGTLWSSRVVTGADPRYMGASGAGAHLTLGFGYAFGVGAAVETEGGPGTVGAHWRKSTYSRELMTGWISSGWSPLSLISVGTLRDLGFQVTDLAADLMTPASARQTSTAAPLLAPGAVAADGPLLPLGEQLVGPTYEVSPAGTLRLLVPLTPRRAAP